MANFLSVKTNTDFYPFLAHYWQEEKGEMKVCVAATLAHWPQPPQGIQGAGVAERRPPQ